MVPEKVQKLLIHVSLAFGLAVPGQLLAQQSWDLKTFKLDWQPDNASLEQDLEKAAVFYESLGFNPPTLKVTTEKPAGLDLFSDEESFFLITAANEEGDESPSIGEYQAGQACACCQDRVVYKGRKGSTTRPRIDVGKTALREVPVSIQPFVLPHELFHAVQYSYSLMLSNNCQWIPKTEEWGVTTEKWFGEGMTEAMAGLWFRNAYPSRVNENAEARPWIRGWRNYSSSLHEPNQEERWNAGFEGDALNAKGYGTSSFWRYLKPAIIKSVLEFQGEPTSGMELDWLDQAIKHSQLVVCKELFPNGLPVKDAENPSCEEGSDSAGLYLVYPAFINSFTHIERHRTNQSGTSALEYIFGPVETTAGASLQEKGCLAVNPEDDVSHRISIHAIGSLCFRVPAGMQKNFYVFATSGEGQLDNLILGWNGCVQPPGQQVNHPQHGRMKIWSVERSNMNPMSSCHKLDPENDLLLVLSNVAPRAIDTTKMDLVLRFTSDKISVGQ
jgi:hypothetical protein